MNTPRAGTTGLVICLLAAAVLVAQAPPSQNISGKQEIQKRVRSMARQLLTGILDVQLRQLEENGLDSLQLHDDVRTMRRHIDELIDAEMPEVLELLGRLPTTPADRQEETFVLARQKSREVLVRLLVERQALLRRLRMAEMVAQVKRLIERETTVLATTEALPEQVQAGREASTLATIEDQRDVKALYLGLEDMLRDASSWGGPVGAEATTGLRLLETGQVGKEMDNARGHLEEIRFSEAAASLEAVIQGLQALLESIERAQGLVQGDAESARETIRQLTTRQEEVREATSQPDLGQTAIDDLAEQQSEIRNQVAQMREELEPSSAAQSPLEEAEEAAYEATADLFEGRPEDAMAEQERVLDALAEAGQQVQREPEPQQANLTAEEHDQLIEDLEGALKDLQEIRQEQEVASETAQSDPKEARKQESRIAEELAAVPEDRHLPAEVTARLDEAEEAAAGAADQMNRPEEPRRRATDAAEQAIERAESEIETALADARRHRLGMEIAELAQAAGALDRAAAAERAIAQESQKASESEGLAEEEAAALSRRQADVADVAAKVAEGVDQTAPEATAILNEASRPIQEAQTQLQAALEQPGQPSKPAAQQAAQQADQAAEMLAKAADEIRSEIGRTAQELAALSGEQFDEATQARQAVEAAIDSRPESMAERLQRLARAEQKVRQAAAEQERAAGRPEAARAMDLADGVRETLELQRRADRSAESLADRPDTGPLEAIARQQDVAQAADRLQEQAARERQPDQEEPPETQDKPQEAPQDAPQPQPDALAEALDRAEGAAAEAARDLLDAKPAEARAARSAAREALQQAFELASAEAQRAQEAPPGEPDLEAQQLVGEAVAEAHALAQPDAPEAADTLAEAGQASQQAEQEVAQHRPDAARQPQAATADMLERAEAQLAEAVDRLAAQAAEQLAEQSQEAGELTDRAIPVDPGATGHLQAAESEAARGQEDVAQAPEQAAPTEEKIAQAMDEAVADLAARQQQLARDKALAEALARLAAQQQEAADQLARSPEPPPDDEPPDALADALAEAWQQLAQAQQSTVQAAQQVAGQSQMTNEPIQQATALAAGMAQPDEPSQTSSPTATQGGPGRPARREPAPKPRPTHAGGRTAPRRRRHPRFARSKRRRPTTPSP
ncbi:hypothetical protein ACFL5Q_02555 [Planctomycetota bacterium]